MIRIIQGTAASNLTLYAFSFVFTPHWAAYSTQYVLCRMQGRTFHNGRGHMPHPPPNLWNYLINKSKVVTNLKVCTGGVPSTYFSRYALGPMSGSACLSTETETYIIYLKFWFNSFRAEDRLLIVGGNRKYFLNF